MEAIINASDFIDLLKKEGLVIVSKSFLESNSEKSLIQKRLDLLAKKSLTIKELLDLQLLPVKSKQAIRKWIEKGTIKKSEVATGSDGKIRIQTSFLKRLGYD
ncbi:MAG: hypothetical protein CMP76_17090 [Flavobacterium sp.]|uniref:hypothetical protein n=1 Tax=Flavobacterium sp. TaxID=239 RepID=UPI000C54EEFD|nr:hypothetical protein [Flavobacterium sp.]MBF04994.1 hypothetical protein [Flavobacterium sp.]|tara:strand:+ start:1235 stop:1543 length:309 start_codon:yes stop_codon:yes gene_type:complete